MNDLFKRVAGSMLIAAGTAKIVSLSGGNMLSLLFVFGIITGVLAIVASFGDN